MTTVQDRLRSYGPGALLALVLIVLGFFYPQYVESLADLPAIGEFNPSLSSMVIMIVFTIIAVGLNIVLEGRGLPAYDPSLPYVLLPIGCTVGAREGSGLVAVAHPTQARIAFQERQELSG